MSQDVIAMVVGLTGIVIIVAIGKAALVESGRLGIGVFRPYRGDPWPIGVQEDDDARFSWTRRPVARAFEPGDDAAEDHLAHAAFRPPRVEPAMPAFEEIGTPQVEPQALTGAGVHRARH